LGHFSVYEDTWEQILRNLKKECAVPEDWMPVSDTQDQKGAGQNNASTDEPSFSSKQPLTQQWEYKWVDNGVDIEVYGPFSGENMEAWNDQGFFTQGILVRKAGTDDEFVSSSNINFLVAPHE